MVHALITLAAAGSLATADLGVLLEPNRYLAVSGAGTDIETEARVTNHGPDDAPAVVVMLRVEDPRSLPSPMRSQDVRCTQETDEALRCQLDTVPANGPPKIIRFRLHGHPAATVVAEISSSLPDPVPDNDTARGSIFEAPASGGGGGCRLAAGSRGGARALSVVLVIVLWSRRRRAVTRRRLRAP